MNVTDVNAVLLILVLLAASGAAAVWMDPRASRNLSNRLRARSQALTAARREYRRVYEDTLCSAQEEL